MKEEQEEEGEEKSWSVVAPIHDSSPGQASSGAVSYRLLSKNQAGYI